MKPDLELAYIGRIKPDLIGEVWVDRWGNRWAMIDARTVTPFEWRRRGLEVDVVAYHGYMLNKFIPHELLQQTLERGGGVWHQIPKDHEWKAGTTQVPIHV